MAADKRRKEGMGVDDGGSNATSSPRCSRLFEFDFGRVM